MGYGDAEVFLSQLSDVSDSSEVPEDWRGGISGLTYKFGGELANGRWYYIRAFNVLWSILATEMQQKRHTVPSVFRYIILNFLKESEDNQQQ